MVENFNAISISCPGNLDTLSLVSLPIPVLSEGQVLVQMEYSTINPSDYLTATGFYPSPSPPLLLGKEGSGTVIKSGGGDLADSLLNKRVSVAGTNTWTDYTVANAFSVYPLRDTTSFEQGATLIVNPMTVAMFYDKLQTSGTPAAVQNAAASALGKMLVKLCKAKGIPLVNLVRRQEQVDILREIGAEHVFNTSEEGWKLRAREVCKELGVAVGFDAVAGQATSDMADLINDGGVVYNYGLLTGEDCRFGPLHLIFQGKRLDGLLLTPWLMGKTHEGRVEVAEFVQSMIEVFTPEHGNVVNLSQIIETLKSYSETSTTNKKILIRNRLE